MSKQPTFIDVMRHGEPVGTCPSGGTILRGSTDHALTKKGWLQANQRVETVLAEGEGWDIIISSPLIRCAEFSSSLAETQNINDRFFIKPQWREIHYGDWDGKSTADIWKNQPELMENMWQAPLEFCAPNGESVKDFDQRIEQAWLDLLTEFQGKRILLLCHGGVMRLLLKQLLLLAPEGMNRFAIPYAAMSRFRIDHGEQPGQHWPSLLSHCGEELSGEKIGGESKSEELNDE
jgi:alpha-ribazole phosphatase